MDIASAELAVASRNVLDACVAAGHYYGWFISEQGDYQIKIEPALMTVDTYGSDKKIKARGPNTAV